MSNLKSISFFFFYTTLYCSVNGISVLRNQNDLIPATDFGFHLDSLEKLVDFYANHKYYLDLTSAFGLYMAEVNLRPNLEGQQYDYPVGIRSRLEKLLLKIGGLSAYFHFMVQQLKSNAKGREEVNHWQEIQLSELFFNKTTWPINPVRFDTDLLKNSTIYSEEQLLQFYGQWDEYLIDVNREQAGKEKDHECIAILVKYVPSTRPKNCFPPALCNKRVGEGTDVGSKLSLWVFIMIIARFSRQCFVFSESEDRKELDAYCAKYYREVQYIAMHDFKQPVTASHHCSICGLLGHSQFFKKFWHKKLNLFQTSEGCYSVSIQAEKFDDEEGKNIKQEYVMNRHVMYSNVTLHVDLVNEFCHVNRQV